FVIADPAFVVFVQVFQVVQPHGVFVFTSPFLNLPNQFRDIGSEVNQQVGCLNKVDHRVENVQVALVIAVADMAAFVQVGGKNVGIFIYGAVLNGGVFISPDFINLAEPAVQEID